MRQNIYLFNLFNRWNTLGRISICFIRGTHEAEYLFVSYMEYMKQNIYLFHTWNT